MRPPQVQNFLTPWEGIAIYISINRDIAIYWLTDVVDSIILMNPLHFVSQLKCSSTLLHARHIPHKSVQ
jgi:hypothetical protein